jgi:hypothetical protein
VITTEDLPQNGDDVDEPLSSNQSTKHTFEEQIEKELEIHLDSINSFKERLLSFTNEAKSVNLKRKSQETSRVENSGSVGSGGGMEAQQQELSKRKEKNKKKRQKKLLQQQKELQALQEKPVTGRQQHSSRER